ncbi:MAG: NAD(P)-dependent alcohol dehydrogenase [Acidimicrobiia bacterium]|nr:NAD(P)-dependent alcohol dehydrogenase [Acidimicrobiia bacterium]
MNALVQDRYGSPDVLELRSVDRPAPGPDQVLIRVVSSCINPADWHRVTGTPIIARPGFGSSYGWRRPKNAIPGCDVAGVVETVGTGVTDFAPGDRVFAEIGVGGFAEYALAPARALARIPDSVTFAQAASIPVAGLTALQGLRDQGAVAASSRVLVIGASGGVGTFAVQIAKAMGAEVTAVCSTAKTDLVRSLGADHVIDYTEQDYLETAERFDVVLDNVGNRPHRHIAKVLTPDGRYVMVSGPKRRWIGPIGRMVTGWLAFSFRSQQVKIFVAKSDAADLAHLAALVAAGDVEPVIGGEYSLAEVPGALRQLGHGHTLGKAVVNIAASREHTQAEKEETV